MTAYYMLRYMRNEDIPQVVEVDKLSFSAPWSARSYAFEVNDNNSSHMITLEAQNDLTPSASSLRGVLQRLSGQSPAPTVIGYAGLWLIEGEAHVSTIAVHPTCRGKGLGEVLLNGLLMRALALGGEYSVLEVRVSNESAQALYRKYGYETVGRRKNYYRDNNEDAFLMHLAPLNEVYQAQLITLRTALQARLQFTDQLAQANQHRAGASL